MHTVYATICFGKDEKEAYQKGLKIFDGFLKSKRDFGIVDWYLPFDGKEHKDSPEYRMSKEIMGLDIFKGFTFSNTEGRNRYYHKRWRSVIEGDSEEAKEIFEFLSQCEEKEKKDEKWWFGNDEESDAWINSGKLWATVLFVPADNEYGFEKVSLHDALKATEDKKFYIVPADFHE